MNLWKKLREATMKRMGRTLNININTIHFHFLPQTPSHSLHNFRVIIKYPLDINVNALFSDLDSKFSLLAIKEDTGADVPWDQVTRIFSQCINSLNANCHKIFAYCKLNPFHFDTLSTLKNWKTQ